MTREPRQIINELGQLLEQFEAAMQGGFGAAREQAGETVEQLQAGLKQARERVEDLQQGVRDGIEKGADATDQFVRRQPWVAVGIAAAAAFVLGLLVARRD